MCTKGGSPVLACVEQHRAAVKLSRKYQIWTVVLYNSREVRRKGRGRGRGGGLDKHKIFALGWVLDASWCLTEEVCRTYLISILGLKNTRQVRTRVRVRGGTPATRVRSWAPSSDLSPPILPTPRTVLLVQARHSRLNYTTTSIRYRSEAASRYSDLPRCHVCYALHSSYQAIRLPFVQLRAARVLDARRSPHKQHL